jgi:acyl transferase domain-containing protein
MSQDAFSGNEIAIVGMSGRFPDAPDLDAFWRNLRDGVESVRPQSDEALRAAGVSEAALRDPSYVKAAAVLDGFDHWDERFFGFSPRDAAIMDPQHRLFLELAVEALEHAGHAPASFGGAIGVFASVGAQTYYHQHVLRNRSLLTDVGLFLLRHTGNDKDFLSTRVSYLLDLKGPSVNVQTACSSSLVAIHMAAQSLLNGETDLALAGACTIELPHGHGYHYHAGEILSPDGHCRPFDAASGGTVFGSGGGIVVLRRLQDALEAGDTIHGVILGSAVNNDGAGKVGYLAPSVDGQAAAIAEALDIAGIPADSIGLVEAHGTGTAVGDPIEVAALTQAFRRTTSRRGFCRLGSLKSNIGHTDTAAGVAGLLKVVLAMRARQIPPTLHFTAPNPAAQLPESPFTVNTTVDAWPSPMRAGVSSLGVGGTNAHVIVQEPPAGAAPGAPVRFPPLVVSAHTRSALETLTSRLADALDRPEGVSLSDAAFTMATGRTPRKERLAVVADSPAEAAALLRRGIASAKSASDRRVAFMYAGGGAQYAGMGHELALREPVYRDAIERAVAVMPASIAAGVRRILRGEATAAEASRPETGLPALVAVQLGMTALARAAGLTPSAVIGHSVGEYTAAHVAGVLTHDDLIRIVVARGRLFATLPSGAMTSVAGDLAAVRALVAASGGAVSIAAENATALCVVSGAVDAVAAFETQAVAAGLEVRRVPIDVAAHSPMLEPILDAFEHEVSTLRLSAPTIPVASNLSGEWLTAAEATSPRYWRRHLRETVRYADGLRRILDDSSRVLLELGPGRTLTSLVRQHADAAGRVALASMRRADDTSDDGQVWHNAIGQLWSEGVEISWGGIFRAPRRRIPLPTTPFERNRHWVEPDATDASADAPMSRPDARETWLHVPVWNARPTGTGSVSDGTVLVLHRGAEGRRLAEHLAAQHPRGAAGVLELALGASDGVGSAIAQIRSTAGALARIIVASALDAEPLSAPADVVGQSALLLADLLAVAKHTLEVDEAAAEIVCVTCGAASVAGEPVARVAGSALHGATPVVRREAPRGRAWSVDLGLGAQGTPRLCRAAARALLADAPGEGVVAIRNGQTFVRRFATSAPVVGASPLPEHPVVLISGGLGGLSLAIAQELAPMGARLGLLSTRGVPPRETWDAHCARVGDADDTARRIRAIRALEAQGAEVLVLAADVTNLSAVDAAVRTIVDRWGRIDVVLHAAGVLDDALLVRKEASDLPRVLAPKIGGAIALDLATRELAPSRFVCFSSVSALAGLPGQFDYAAANAQLDAFATWRDAMVGPTVAIGWPAWRNVGMAATAGRSSVRTAPVTGTQPSTVHPLLDLASTLEGGGMRYEGVIGPEKDWVLDEHRLADGTSVLPGAAMVDLFLAVARQSFAGPVALSEVMFQSALRVADDGRAVIHVIATPQGSGLQLRLLGETRDGAWELATATATAGGESPWPSPSVEALPVVDRARARQTSLAFGPRWTVLESLSLGSASAMADLALSAAYAAEAAQHAAHPALYDIATAAGLALLGDDPAVAWVPSSVGTLRSRVALPARVRSFVTLRRRPTPTSAVFDVVLVAEDGSPVLMLDEFTMRAVSVTAFAAGAAAAEPAVGISPDDGVAIARRLLSDAPAPHTVVSPGPLDDVIKRLVAPPAAQTRRASAAPADAPIDDLERTIAAEFQSRLGGGAVGRHDDFFELGGHSLLLTQVLTRLRSVLKVDLPVRAVFTAPTVAALATLARQSTPAKDEPPPLVRGSRDGRRAVRGSVTLDQSR